MEEEPVRGRRYVVRGYPVVDEEVDGEELDLELGEVPKGKRKVKKEEYIAKDEVLTDEDPRVGAWEIGHLTQGPYALDSWRIFCRDVLRGVATGWNGEGAEACRRNQSRSPSHSQTGSQPISEEDQNTASEEEGKVFQPEWMRVLPRDKELRAFLRWMWLKEGFEWDPVTGEKEVASAELLRAVEEGRIMWDDKGGLFVCEDEVEVVKEVESAVQSGL